LKLEVSQRPCLLLQLQDQNQPIQGLAIAEAQCWGLTPRETEVWLLRRAGHLRKDIAANLFITIETVKKHLKNIQAKRQAVVEEQDWDVQAS
jgi:DNA-binding CsgD family transcriptional regulator